MTIFKMENGWRDLSDEGPGCSVHMEKQGWLILQYTGKDKRFFVQRDNDLGAEDRIFFRKLEKAIAYAEEEIARDSVEDDDCDGDSNEEIDLTISGEREAIIDQIAKAMYLGDYNVTTGGKRWEQFTAEEKSSDNFPYTVASKYRHRAENVVRFLEEAEEA